MQRELPKKYGDEGETFATRFLEQEGFLIIERNYFARKLGEIDIIASRDDVLHFIEVKSGKELTLTLCIMSLLPSFEKSSTPHITT